MRVEHDLKLSGYFWLPSNREKRIAGTLSILNGGKVELEIIGHFSDDFPDFNNLQLGRIIGLVEELTLVTLENCCYSKPSYSFNGISKSKVRVEYALAGIEYEENEAVSFDSFNFSIDALEDWVGVTGISVETKRDFLGANIKFQLPEPINYQLSNGLDLSIRFGYSMPFRNAPLTLNLSQNTFFKITSHKPLTIKDVISFTHKFITFLQFAIDANVSLKSVFCFSNAITQEIGGENRPDPIGLYYSSFPFEEKIPTIESDWMLFRYMDIKGRFNQIIDKWMVAYDNFAPSLNLYFSTKIGAQKYIDGKFLALAQALETYHRRTSTETYIAKNEFQELLQQIKSNCPEQHKKWLASRIDYGNEISLRNRLNRIIESFKSHIGPDETIEKTIKLIVDTRNYLTHYDPKLESKAAKGRDLWLLCQKMEAILQLHLLKELDFDDNEINTVLSNSYKFKNKLIGD